MPNFTPKDCCDFCKVRHEQVRCFRRVVCAKTGKFVTVWQGEGTPLYCAQTGKSISETYIKTESRKAYYFWSKRKAKLRIVKHKDGIKTEKPNHAQPDTRRTTNAGADNRLA